MKLDGILTRQSDGSHVVTFDRVIDRPVAKVWAALTDERILKNWLGNVEVELRVGGKFAIQFREITVSMTGTITALEPERVLEYSWFEENGLPQSLLRWELVPEGSGCRLKLIHRFPPGVKVRDMTAFLGGWEAYLNVFVRGVDGEFVSYSDQNEAEIAAGYRARHAKELAAEDEAAKDR